MTSLQGDRQKTLDELPLEIEQFSQKRASHVSVESDDEEETCLLLHEPAKAIIDTGCGRCVIGALTLEAHQSVMGDQAKEIVWHYDTPSVVFYYGNGTKGRSMGVIDLPCVVGGQDMQIKMHVVPGEVPCLLSNSWLKENGAVLNTSSEELLLTKKQITAPMTEGPSGHFELDLCSREKDFGEGRTGTLTRFEGFAQHTFESSGDLLENHDPEMLPLPAEQYPMIGGPKTLLRKRQVKQILSTTERILEVRAITSGSDISLASFSDSRVDLTEVAGRHGIEIADQVSCAAGWNPLSSSGRHRFWHNQCLTPKLIIYRFPVAVQQWLSIPNPSDLSLQPRFRSARDQLRLYLNGMCWQHMQKRYFLPDTSMIPGSDIGGSAGPVR